MKPKKITPAQRSVLYLVRDFEKLNFSYYSNVQL